MDDESYLLLMNKKKMKNPHMFLNKGNNITNIMPFKKEEDVKVEDNEKEEPLDQNEEILEILKDRMKIGRERYGHGLRINDDTRKWGTKDDSWEEMALEEILDGMIYTCCAILRLKKNRKEYEKVEVIKEGINENVIIDK